ncbi:KpsF/GutQ family sugar-phosphate isomerase [Hirschia baltica]|uniref:KpsF/GutQ family protein n=1 Tax=Hirschia baltica (strain ATCC 49814 / DSM 5838 / IFAM 1418) TaxID=582402 RepID=C6XS18_HIRBI|nr:KpsF/GutQ family sugar-phosphate isomerase [Hirschia baltica]ACT60859.1 KpsF/GutQ family protein [Hirschia baltica ATCC 49814]
MDYLASARDVINCEIKGLEALVQALNVDSSAVISEAFPRAIKLMQNVEGRIIVSGMGKSGHIANKIAATLASTGAPSSFVHPGEASHGDLGMISQKDIVLAISNSGETKELADIIAYTRRFKIPLIAITSGANSSLAKACDCLLLLPPAAEACGQTRAPTTSTTMTLAIGDALAVTLLTEKGFGETDFKVYHPGGKLGAAFRRVSDLVRDHANLPLVQSGSIAGDAVPIISQGGFGCVGVINSAGDLEGMITDGDLRRHFGKNFSTVIVDDIMTKSPLTITNDMLAARALELISSNRITALFVLEDKKPIGILHVHDCLSDGVI